MPSKEFKIALTIKEQDGASRKNQACHFSVPLKQGELFDTLDLHLVSPNSVFPCQFKPLASWPDGSIKHLFVTTVLSCERYSEQEFSLTHTQSIPKITNKYAIDYRLNTHLDLLSLPSLFNLVSFELKLANQAPCLAMLKNVNLVDDVLTQQLSAEAEFDNKALSQVRLKLMIELSKSTGDAKVKFELVNQKAAIHPNGLWDLGDPNSILVEYFNCLITTTNSHSSAKIHLTEHDTTDEAQTFSNARLYQASSGGRSWNCSTHLSEDNKVELEFCGYQITPLDSENKKVIRAGQRAQVETKISDTHSLKFEQFWQKFPKALNVSGNQITLELLPKAAYCHELQPGEQFEYSLSSYQKANFVSDYSAPIQVLLSPEYLEQVQVLPYFRFQKKPLKCTNIIAQGLNGPANFFQKREDADEYGWRNFGELYADHEALEYQGKEVFVSHYNNQYDPIYGFIRQGYITGNSKWFELANDLANHVKNIDIYHTTQDKAEYNKGLFWHTDHYLPAATATHRTYSKHHEQGAYIDHAGGGGPGGQHCYTTGLMYHYFLTAEDSSKQTVLDLTDWITCIYDGQGGLLEWLLALKNSKMVGMKNMLNGQYPLDRGIGNYVTALLDSFTLTSKRYYLNRAFYVLSHTIHPADELSKRALDDVENTWFYNVLLQAAIKFLMVKEIHQELDDDFYYVRDALLHYADWMLAHEYPYLDKPEILEYPNHTWTAQDLRKANNLYFAAYYADTAQKRQAYAQKAAYFYHYVVNTLEFEPTKDVTRILAILMQNHGVHEYFESNSYPELFSAVKEYNQVSHLNKTYSIQFVIKTGFQRLCQLSIKREIKWLCKRSSRIAKLFERGR